MVREFPAFHCDKEKMDITDVISKMKVVEDSLNSFIKQNNDQMRELTSSVAKATISAPRGVITRSDENLETPGTKRRRMANVEESVTGITPVQNNIRTSPAFSNVVRQNIPGVNEQCQFPALQPSQQQIRHLQQQQQQHYQPRQFRQPSQTPGRPNSDSSRNNQRKNPTLVFGNGTTTDVSDKFSLTADVNLVASGVSKDITIDQLKNFITSKGITVTDIALLTNFYKEESKSYSYRIAIKAADYEKVMNPDVWPYRVSIHLYKTKRSQPQQDWNPKPPVRQNSRPPVISLQTSTSTPQQDEPVTPLELHNRFDVNGFQQEVSN